MCHFTNLKMIPEKLLSISLLCNECLGQLAVHLTNNKNVMVTPTGPW